MKNELTRESCSKLFAAIRRQGRIEKMDDKELLWWLMRPISKLRDGLPVFGAEEALFSELENRLYPEYDGEKVQYQKWGWSREGEDDLVYVPQPLEREIE